MVFMTTMARSLRRVSGTLGIMVNRPTGGELTPVLSEEELIGELRRLLAGDAPGVILGPGDDAALVEFGPHLGILTADLLVESVHFDRETTSPRDLGYKSVAVNVSDIAAMGGSPRYGLVSLGLPPATEPAWVVDLYGGMLEATSEYAMSIVGGDVSRSQRIVVSISLFGQVARGTAVKRSGARPGDRLVVTGALGAAAGGLRLAQAEPGEVASAVGTDWGRELLRALFRPLARVGEGQVLALEGATAMIDVSDGLALDLTRLCRESGVGARVELAKVPVAAGLVDLARVLPVAPRELALSGGEDYELLATVRPGALEEAAAKVRDRFGTALTEIGEIRAGADVVAIETDGTELPLEPKGWDHFA
jgi:thiamine-monophosphate kinase